MEKLSDEKLSEFANWIDWENDDQKNMTLMAADLFSTRSALAKVEKATAWIPVEERLPEKETTEQWEMYLCKLDRYGEIKIAPLSFMGGSWYSESHSRYDDFVIEWQELPQPPEVQNER
jgi:hypothetical protein